MTPFVDYCIRYKEYELVLGILRNGKDSFISIERNGFKFTGNLDLNLFKMRLNQRKYLPFLEEMQEFYGIKHEVPDLIKVEYLQKLNVHGVFHFSLQNGEIEEHFDLLEVVNADKNHRDFGKVSRIAIYREYVIGDNIPLIGNDAIEYERIDEDVNPHSNVIAAVAQKLRDLRETKDASITENVKDKKKNKK